VDPVDPDPDSDRQHCSKVISKTIIFFGILKEQDLELDPLVRGRDPRIPIPTKVSRIRNTAFFYVQY
jgi:hypothetical protein